MDFLFVRNIKRNIYKLLDNPVDQFNFVPMIVKCCYLTPNAISTFKFYSQDWQNIKHQINKSKSNL